MCWCISSFLLRNWPCKSSFRQKQNSVLRLKKWEFVWLPGNRSWRRFFMTWRPVLKKKRNVPLSFSQRKKRCSKTLKFVETFNTLVSISFFLKFELVFILMVYLHTGLRAATGWRRGCKTEAPARESHLGSQNEEDRRRYNGRWWPEQQIKQG